MVGVGQECISRELPDGRKLALHMNWESDRSLIDGVATIHGTLPGAGCTAYELMITKSDNGDLDEDSLQEFNFRGGGNQKPDYVPPVVRKAFDDWYAKLSQPRVLKSPTSVTVQFVGSVKTKEGADYALTCIRNFTKREPFETSDLTPEKAEEVRKEHQALQALRSKVRGNEAADEEGRTGTAEPEPIGPRNDSGVKGLSIRVHPDVEEINLAFVDYGNCWVAAGSVKIPISAFEARAPILMMLGWLGNLDVELEVKEVWLEADHNTRFQWGTGGRFASDEYHADAAARGENPYYPGLASAPVGGYRYANPTGVWKTEAQAWLTSNPSSRSWVTKEDVEALYAAGAVNVDITFDNSRSGLEATPPLDRDARRRILALIKTHREAGGDWGEDEEEWAKWAEADSGTDPWLVF
jgi:hypothetical protein